MNIKFTELENHVKDCISIPSNSKEGLVNTIQLFFKEEEKYISPMHCHPLILKTETYFVFKCIGDSYFNGECQSNFKRFSGDLDINVNGIKVYFCKICSVYICIECFNTTEEVKKQSPFHQHPLYLSFRRSNWRCDGRRFGNGCENFHKRGIGSNPDTRFRCQGCDFDLCIDCIDRTE